MGTRFFNPLFSLKTGYQNVFCIFAPQANQQNYEIWRGRFPGFQLRQGYV